MRVNLKGWLLVPFLGGSDESRNQHQEKGRDGRKFTANDGMVAKHESAAAFANKGEEELVSDYNAPMRWYFIATLFPLIAGCFGPMASMFNICAVAISWRLIVDPSSKESQGEHIADPEWLVATNAVSLAIAIVANLSLLLHMTGRIRFNFGAPITILGWLVAGLIDVALAAAAPTYLPLPANALATYSQAYYYAIFSGVIYVLLSMMLTVTALGVWVGNYSSEFKLSLAQRSLMLQTILFLGYVLAAAAVYAEIESWIFLDAVYYVIVTLFTIGFGDLSPQTHLGRSLYFPMSIGGILFVGLIIGNIRTLVLESISVKVSTRLVEKARYTAIKSGNAEGILRVRGLHRRDTNASTELERRENEFNVMREIQATSAHDNRLIVLFLAATAFLILWFVGAVCFWQAEQAVGGQHWTYFESVYFTYTAQLTIGYGDFEPQSESAKPTFVFWALIALPTLTVLIGAIGDAVTDFVNWATLWLGQHAPDVLSAVTGLSKKKVKVDASNTAAANTSDATVDSDGNERKAFEGIADVEKGKVVPAGMSANSFGELALHIADVAYRPFLVIQAAQKVIGHLDEDTPRKYTYLEWSFLLTLLGEDEGTEQGHRRIGQPLLGNAQIASPVVQHKHEVWSWMGQESPLMSLEDDSEPKWVLKRIMVVLEKDFKRRGDHRMEREKRQAT